MTMEQTEQEVAPPVEPAVGAVEEPVQSPLENTVTGQAEDGPVSDGAVAAPAAAPPTPTLDTGGRTEPSPPPPGYTPEQLGQMQQAAAQYEQVQVRAALQKQADERRQQLEGMGYLPEQAQQSAAEYMQFQEQILTLQNQGEAYGQHLHGQQMVAEVFAKRYNLGIDDLAELRRYQDPQSMESAAKKMSGDRERDTELARLRQAQVPAQSFDNSQGNPQVAANEGSWLDRYNAGDRSPNAEAAARRAAGFS